MRPEQILNDLRARGIRLVAVGERLCIDAPKGALGPDLVNELRRRKAEMLAILPRSVAASPDPTRSTTGPSPPHQGVSNFDLGEARAEFERHGTQPAWDDLVGAARLERQRAWCQETLDAAYRGQLTLWLDPSGHVMAAPRGAVS